MTAAQKLPESTQGLQPPALKGGLPILGHMIPFARNPFEFMKKTAAQLGEIARFKIFSQTMILLTGDEASQLFYRSTDEQLDQSAAYKLMTPIFGEGIVFDAPNERKNQQLKMLMPALRAEAMREHSYKIVQEVEDMTSQWGESGEIELVSAMKQLTINTASHCLLGREFRYELTEEFAEIYHDLEKGVNALAYSFPYLPIPAFRKRDRARVRLKALVKNIIQKREHQKEKPTDMFQMLIDTQYDDGSKLSENEITGMLIGAIFAGHHTSSGTAAWVLLELLKHPEHLVSVTQELDSLLGTDGAVTFQTLREVPLLENVLKEVLRLHPPLIVLMRQVAEDLQFKQYTIKKGDMVWASPPVTHRMEKHFSNPNAFDPSRYNPERAEDKNLMAYQPFGGGKHKCSGNAFAMFQIKAIFSVLLRQYDFELVDPAETYVDDYREMIVQPKSPCRIRYRKKQHITLASSAQGNTGALQTETSNPNSTGCPFSEPQKPVSADNIETGQISITIDRQLCQGHGMCMGEAPDIFHIEENGELTLLKPQIKKDQLVQARNAEKHCPNQAIKVAIDSLEKN